MSKKELKRYTTRALKLEDGPIPEAVFLPPAIRGRMVNTVYETKGKPVSIQQHVVRIQEETDPVGLLIAIANGQPVPTVIIDKDGNQDVKFETLDLKDRLSVIKFLSDKVLPRMSINKKVDPGNDDGWEATLSNAAEHDDD